jgi:hypothetical protein
VNLLGVLDEATVINRLRDARLEQIGFQQAAGF